MRWPPTNLAHGHGTPGLGLSFQFVSTTPTTASKAVLPYNFEQDRMGSLCHVLLCNLLLHQGPVVKLRWGGPVVRLQEGMVIPLMREITFFDNQHGAWESKTWRILTT